MRLVSPPATSLDIVLRYSSQTSREFAMESIFCDRRNRDCCIFGNVAAQFSTVVVGYFMLHVDRSFSKQFGNKSDWNRSNVSMDTCLFIANLECEKDAVLGR